MDTYWPRWGLKRAVSLVTAAALTLGQGVAPGPGLFLGARQALAAPADLDPTYGIAGKITLHLGGNETPQAVALQPDGKLIVAAVSNASGTNDFVLLRLLPNGVLDPSFGSGGVTTTNFGGEDVPRGLVLQLDGKIAVAGHTNAAGGEDFILARYLPNGALDQSFGTGGKVITSLGGTDQAYALALQPDGKLVAAGVATPPGSNPDFALVRYLPNGALDPSFGTNGTVTTHLGGGSEAIMGVAVRPDGRIVAAGHTNAAGLPDFAVARYLPNGAIDQSFGGGGFTITDFGTGRHDHPNQLHLLSDGAILVGGSSGPLSGTVFTQDFALAKYLPSGTLDPAFGSGGKVLTNFVSDEVAYGMAVTGVGEIILVGHTGQAGGSAAGFNMALARYLPSGALDPSFGTGGKHTLHVNGGDVAFAVAVQQDGRPVVAGVSGIGTATQGDITVLRLEGSTPPPPPPPLNQPPSASAGGPYSVAEGGAVQLSGSGSDPDNDPLTYAWDLNGDSVFETSGKTATFSAAGIDGPAVRTVALRVCDDENACATSSATVSVQNVAPTASFVVPGGAFAEGSSFTLALTNAADVSSADTAAGFTFAFDCGDGTGYGATSPAATRACAALDNPGVTVKGKVIDKDGSATEYTGTVAVTNVGPTVAPVSAPKHPLMRGEVATLTASFTDPGLADTFTAVWHWGDGTTSAGTITRSGASGTATGTHTHARAGHYHGTLVLTDKDGASSSQSFVLQQANGQPPVTTPAGPKTP